MEQEELLLYLHRASGLCYLSDLPQAGAATRRAVVQAASLIPSGRYPASEWRECVHYLTGSPPKAETETELRAALARAWG